MNRFRAIVAGTAVMAAATLCGAEQPYELKPDNQLEVNSVLASVNGEPISLWDVLPATRQQEYQAYAAYSGDRLYEAIRQIRRKTVDDLIDRKLLIADYRDQAFRDLQSGNRGRTRQYRGTDGIPGPQRIHPRSA